MQFLSFAANFTFTSALKHLFRFTPQETGTSALKESLKIYYNGDSYIYYNARTAVYQALKIALPDGGKVGISGLSCFALPQAIKAAGCEVVYIDIEPKSLHFDAKTLEDRLKTHPDIKIIIVQNMLGLPADIAAIKKLCDEKGILIIEDLAHSVGITYDNHHEAGRIGDFTVLSFGKGKAIDTVHGGALIIRNSIYKNKIEAPAKTPTFSIRFRDRIYPMLGWLIRRTYRVYLGRGIAALAMKTGLILRSSDGDVLPDTTLTGWQSSLALEQFENISNVCALRHKNALALSTDLRARIPEAIFSSGSAPLRLPLLVSNRDAVEARLEKAGFHFTDIWYNVPISPVRYYDSLNYPEDENPEATQIAKKILNLPTLIQPKKLQKAIDIINEAAHETGD